jgi:hypothetical protein
MPDAWVNINAAAFSVEDSDPICRTCDIRATVRGPRRINVGPVAWSVAPAARVWHSIFARVSGAVPVAIKPLPRRHWGVLFLQS